VTGSVVVMLSKSTWVSPLIVAVVAGTAPLYGTCTSLTCVMAANISTKRCPPEPLPAEAYASLSGLAFASAMRSFTVRTGSDGWTATMNGVLVTCVTGEKSRSGSYGSFL
jgi:hypothetical protein